MNSDVSDSVVLMSVGLCISLFKLLMIPTYRSTDYEVHRNWLAITHSLPLNKWYTENTSEWTLDYPPFFAWFEFVLSQFAPLFDDKMLKVNNLNYVSYKSVLFHKLTVICADSVFLYAVYHFCLSCVPKKTDKSSFFYNSKVVIGVLLMTNFGLFIIDHIHFQYNGFMYGILLLSFTAMYKQHYMTATLHFATLLNFKHIYLYIAPAYGLYLLRVYCFHSSKKDGRVLWKTFSVRRFLMLATLVITVFGMSLGPFMHMGQLEQVLSRLFPFKRGLCHAYWAPNFWALYNTADKLLYTAGRFLDLVPVNEQSAAMTGGLVQEFDHAVLPSIKPLVTFVLTILYMAPSLVHMWLNPTGPRSFVRCVCLCAFTSFMFGWHVHEKAILLVLIPLTLLSLDSPSYCKHFVLLSVTGHVSLFPLIYTQFEQPILWFGFISYTVYTMISVYKIVPGLADKKSTSLLNTYERVYLYGLALVLIYYSIGHNLLGLSERLPFLPLLLMSVYTSLGVAYSYLGLYSTVLSESMIKKLRTQ